MRERERERVCVCVCVCVCFCACLCVCVCVGVVRLKATVGWEVQAKNNAKSQPNNARPPQDLIIQAEFFLRSILALGTFILLDKNFSSC